MSQEAVSQRSDLVDQVLTVRGQRALLDTTLANLYGVSIKAFNQAVRRNHGRYRAQQ